ncbi:hypothetical protein AFLA_001579 [Aspergillus flavus NRRL3357]|nr:hypothetical protein AFLA_001579 [Aspergillus flavus NRRL3357]
MTASESVHQSGIIIRNPIDVTDVLLMGEKGKKLNPGNRVIKVSEEIPSGFGNLELQSHAEAYSTTVTDEPTESGLALVLPHPALGGWTDATNRLAAGLRRFGSALGSTRLTKGCRHCPVVQSIMSNLHPITDGIPFLLVHMYPGIYQRVTRANFIPKLLFLSKIGTINHFSID